VQSWAYSIRILTRLLCKHILNSGCTDGLDQQTLRICSLSVMFIGLCERDVSYIPHIIREIRQGNFRTAIRTSAETLAAILRNFRLWPRKSSGEHPQNFTAWMSISIECWTQERQIQRFFLMQLGNYVQLELERLLEMVMYRAWGGWVVDHATNRLGPCAPGRMGPTCADELWWCLEQTFSPRG